MIYLQMKTYIQKWWGREKDPGKEKKVDKNQIKTPPSIMWRADCFSVSANTENKPDYPMQRLGLN